MTGPIAAKASKDKIAEQADRRLQERPRQPALSGPQADILALQRAAGNGAVSPLLQSGTGNFAPVAMSKPLARVPQGAGCPLSIIQRQWLERSTGPLPSIITEEGKEGRKTLAKANAHAATRGSQILAEPNALKGEEGRARLAHEVAHVLQQQSSNLPFGTTEQAEADADAFSHSVMAGRPAAVRFSAPLAWAYKKKKVRRGDQVASIVATINANAVVVTMKSGDTIQYSLVECTLKPGSYLASRTSSGLEIRTAEGVPVEGEGERRWIFAFKAPSEDLPDATTLVFPKTPVPLTIIESPRDMPTTKVAPEAGEGVSPPAKVAGAKTEQKKTLPYPPGKEQLPPEVVDFYKGSTVPEGQQIPANELLKMHQTFTKFVKGKPQWGAEGQSFKAWVDFLEKTGERLRGQTELTEHGKLTLDVLEDLMKKLEKGQRLEFPGQEEKELAEKARKAREKEGPPKLSDRPEWLLIPADDRKFLLEVAERHPDLFEETAALDDVKRVTYQMKRALALQIAVKKHMPSEIQAALIRMAKDPVFWAFLAGSIAVYVGLWLAPEPISKVIATGLTAFLLAYSSFSTILNFAKAWTGLTDKCRFNAKTANDLEEAAKEFAVYLGEQGAELLLLIAFWIVGRAAAGAKGKIKAKGKAKAEVEAKAKPTAEAEPTPKPKGKKPSAKPKTEKEAPKPKAKAKYPIDAKTRTLLEKHGFKNYDETTGIATKHGGEVLVSRTPDGRWLHRTKGKVVAEYEIHPYNKAPGTGGFLNAHHPVQGEWARLRLGKGKLPPEKLKNPDLHYGHGDAPTVNLRDIHGGSPHRKITTRQGKRKPTIKDRTYLEERAEMIKDLKQAGVPEDVVAKVLKEVDDYFLKIRNNIKDPVLRDSIFGDWGG